MPRNLSIYSNCQVFLNYPFDNGFNALANGMAFSVVAAGLIPVCALDITSPDRPRLEMLVYAIRNCSYSVHDFSRSTGEGPKNNARMNMPIEMGMGIFHALDSQRNSHRCAFFVPTFHEYQTFASDLAGLDPKCHENNDEIMVREVYNWLRGVVPASLFNSYATVDILNKYKEFKTRLGKINGSENGNPSHHESRELMYRICSECGWWDWRSTRHGLDEFPEVPLSISIE